MDYILYGAIGLAAGVLSALLGVGGGIVVVPMLALVAGLPMKLAVGTSLAYIVPVALSGAVQHGLHGDVNLRFVALAVPLGLLGTYLGVRLFGALSGTRIKQVFGLLMLLVGLKMPLLPQGWQGLQKQPKPAETTSQAAEAP